ncbi:mechanosensitive ion channel family protein [Terasakiella sp. A23]|uniref:mechanosensitive ion channel family protein n=1 Tax=Terasakiella sp. FCG-A23 TaxID=3080561 RepID=UPI0029544FFF|nr:mechanosensitive ion channel family protein [Terasakiella sp. A23]MDV7339602.1 mechanosensitive ion channel family protein [Terasakiella sp. A23]
MQELLDQISGNQLFASLVFVAAMLVLRFLSNRWVDSRTKFEAETKRRFKSNVKNGLFFIVLIALIFVWAPSLRTFALSLTAFAVAIILATKELILCVSGYILKSTGGLIRVGDWIEVNGLRGEVVDQDIMTTTLEELGTHAKQYEFTGRTIIIPNSIFLASTVKNERFNKRYTYHSFDITLQPEVPTGELKKRLMTQLASEIEEFSEVAKRYKALIEKRADITLPENFTDCHVTFLKDAHIQIELTCFVPVNAAMRIENVIKESAADYIADWHAKKKE